MKYLSETIHPKTNDYITFTAGAATQLPIINSSPVNVWPDIFVRALAWLKTKVKSRVDSRTANLEVQLPHLFGAPPAMKGASATSNELSIQPLWFPLRIGGRATKLSLVAKSEPSTNIESDATLIGSSRV